jgi:hypothetical protein
METNMTSEDTKMLAWMREVDEYMVIKHGVGVDDIPDMPYDEWFVNEYTVREAVDEAIRTVNERGEW